MQSSGHSSSKRKEKVLHLRANPVMFLVLKRNANNFTFDCGVQI